MEFQPLESSLYTRNLKMITDMAENKLKTRNDCFIDFNKFSHISHAQNMHVCGALTLFTMTRRQALTECICILHIM